MVRRALEERWMHRLVRLGAAAAIAAATLIGGASGAFAASPGAGVVGHLYVNNNTAGHNTISGFDRHADGSLSPIGGTPFNAGGAGTGSPLGSAGSLQFSADGRYVLAVDAASSQVSVLRVKSDGSLDLVNQSPVSSNGTTPVSIAVHGNLVYVANGGAGGSNYTGFTLNAGGHLSALSGSTYALPDAASPGQVLFSGDGSHLAGTRVGTSQIDSFSVGTDGRLTAASGSPFPAGRLGPFGSEFRPTDPSQLFVSNAHDGPGLGSVSAFNVAADGTLSAVAGSPYADNQTAPCWVEISHDGAYLFAINTAVPSISRYSIAADGSLSLLGAATPFKSPVGLRPFDARLDPSGAYLYVVDAGAAKVSAFAVSGGSLTELLGSPVSIPGGGAPFGMIVD
jgi:6-phosphogluconolactonase (cycloisomerase 2 family)